MNKTKLLGSVIVLGGLLLLGSYEFGRMGMEYALFTFDRPFHRSVASYTVIDVMLHRALVQYNLSRIGIARFHVENKQDFFAVFDSMTASPGVSSNIANLQHISAATLAPVLPALMRDETKLVWTKDLPEGPLRDLSLIREVVVVLYVPIQDSNRQLIGMMTATWLDESHVPDETQRKDMANDLARMARNIGKYMSALPQ